MNTDVDPVRDALLYVDEVLPKLRALREKMPSSELQFGVFATACDRLAVLQSHLYEAVRLELDVGTK